MYRTSPRPENDAELSLVASSNLRESRLNPAAERQELACGHWKRRTFVKGPLGILPLWQRTAALPA